MKNIIIALIFVASNSSAEICLSRKNDVVHPSLNVTTFSVKKDLNRAFHIDNSTSQTECQSSPCKFSRDDMFILDRSGGHLNLLWIKKSNKVVRMKVTMQEKNSNGLRITFLKSEEKNGYIYYLMKRGELRCEQFSRWAQYTGSFCSMYTIEAFQAKSDKAKHIRPDDPAAELKLCFLPMQPGTGTGGEPPP